MGRSVTEAERESKRVLRRENQGNGMSWRLLRTLWGPPSVSWVGEGLSRLERDTERAHSPPPNAHT